jgi:hypothetical protein
MLQPIAPSRGLSHISGALPRILSGFLIMFATAVWLYSQNLLMFRGWSDVMAGLSAVSGVPSTITMSMALPGGLATVVHAPYTVLPMLQSIWIVLALAAGCLVASFVLAPVRLPARYFLRVLAVVLALPALGYFVIDHPATFDLENHIAQVFRLGYWFMLVMPVIYAVTGFILPGNMARRFGIVVLAVTFTYLTVPVLALLHLHAILLAGPAIVPTLNVFFGILILSVELIAFYGLLASQE